MISTGKTWVFLLLIAALLLLASFFIPENGIKISENYSIQFLSWNHLVGEKEQEPESLDIMFALADSLDIVEEEDEVEEPTPVPGEIFQPIQWAINNDERLSPFFNQLDSSTQPMHVFHFGDSQIENDRLTSYIRNKLQQKYGGNGPGWIPLISFSKPGGVSVEVDGPWQQFTLFGSEAKPDWVNFGALCSTAAIGNSDSLGIDTILNASVEISSSTCLYNRAKQFNVIELQLEAPAAGGEFILFADSNRWVQSLDSGAHVYKFLCENLTSELELKFTALPGTMVHGVCLTSNEGVFVHNVPMRGSSGTIFKRTKSGLLHQIDEKQNIGLIIMQYGGNTLPYLEDTAECESYARWLGGQITYLKSHFEAAEMILAGPSDMSIKQGEHYITYPLLPVLRDNLLGMVLEKNIGYFDMLEAMGGEGSMEYWVSADPPLAMPDYTHFSPRGARLMGELMYESIMDVKSEKE